MRDGFPSTTSTHLESMVALAVLLDDHKQSHFGLLSFQLPLLSLPSSSDRLAVGVEARKEADQQHESFAALFRAYAYLFRLKNSAPEITDLRTRMKPNKHRPSFSPQDLI